MDVPGTHTEKSGDHVIPQMVVTSADNEDEKDQDITEAFQGPQFSVEMSSDDSAIKSREDANSSKTIQEVTKEGNLTKDEAAIAHTEESIAHSAIQRPLIIESEKSVSQPSSVEKICPTPPPPPPVSLPQSSAPTTMQRPLVFDGSSPQPENNYQQDQPTFPSNNMPSIEQDMLQRDVTDENGDTEIPLNEKEVRPKTHSFSWIPKLHAHDKESKSPDVKPSKIDNAQDEIQNLEGSEVPAKKDGLQSMKKFFDNLLHDTSSDSKDKPKIVQEAEEFENDSASKKVPKDEKQSYYKKFFGSKSEQESDVIVSKPNEIQVEKDSPSAKESSKDSKYNIKKMFDSFKHDAVDKRESSKIVPDSTDPDIKPGTSSNTSKNESDGKAKDLKLKEEFKEPISPSKESKYNLKKMLDSFKADGDKKESTTKVSNTDVKSKPEFEKEEINIKGEDSSVKDPPKDSKSNLKKMFDSFKHDGSSKKESSKNASEVSSTDIKTDMPVVKISAEQDVQNDIETVKDPPKDSKSNLKKMFDSFKHDGSSKKESSKNASEVSSTDIKTDMPVVKISTEQDVQNDLETVKDLPKDSKSNLKKMFDSFKHDGSSKKESSKNASEVSSTDIKTDMPVVKISTEQDGQNDIETLKKDKSKDSKYNIKKMFDSFKHDDKKDIPKTDGDHTPIDTKPEVPKVEVLQSDSQTQADIESKECHKEPKSSPIKKMFDSLKHDFVDKKDSSPKKESSSSQSDLKPDSFKSHKDSKSGIKKFFDSLKHDASNPDELHSTKSSEKIESLDLNLEKESALQTQKLDDNKDPHCKDGPDFELPELSTFPSEIHDDHTKTLDTTPKLKDEKIKHKDQHGVKKLLSAFKQDHSGSSKGETSKFHVTFMDKENSLKRSHSFKDSMLLKDHPAEQSEKKSKDTFHGMKKFFSSSKETISQSSEGHDESQRKPNEIKRSQSCRETASEKEGFHFKSFFDSFSHKKSSSQSPVPPAGPSEEHIYDVVGKPDPKKYPDSVEKDLKQASKKVKPKEEQSGVKKLFDSLMHKDQTTKPKAIGSEDVIEEKSDYLPSTSNVESKVVTERTLAEESIPIYIKSKDEMQAPTKPSESISKRDVPKAITSPSESTSKKDIPKVIKAPSESTSKKDIPKVITSPSESTSKKDIPKVITSPSESTSKKDIPKGIKAPSESTSKKDIPKVITAPSESTSKKGIPKVITSPSEKAQKPKTPAKPPSVQVNAASSSSDGKTMFNTLSDNIMAMKEKVLHPKESKKSEVNPKDKSCGEYDIREASAKSECVPSTSGIYKPISDDSFIDEKVSSKPHSKIPSLNTSQNKSITKQKEVAQKPVPGDSTLPVKSNIKCPTISPGTPETLYETCCIRLAVLLGKKAMEIVSDQTKSPPKKPPKPSAEAIAKARAEVVSRRLREIQFKGQSVGEGIPVGYDGIRFADDETESSCDYKDVDNFDYIMDYELINRYKCDSKLDTFSDPSTCSGISSYYTADTVTLKDETFSDAPLETISLSSNDSYIFQNADEVHTWPSSKKKNAREKLKVESNLKEPRSVSQVGSKLTKGKGASKKIPPPLPPKPVLSNRMNKLSTSPDSKESASTCINGLSLSPRQQSKFTKDGTPTRQRPLLVAGFKGTEFTSLKTKPKEDLSKPKDRKFNTVLKNESLKTVSTISSPDHKPLQSSKSYPAQVLKNQTSTPLSTAKKVTPQRPPPPNLTLLEKSKPKAPPVPEKPKRESRVNTSQIVPEEKRTISPPRPPPPVVSKISSPPPRPPPPTPKPKPVLSEELGPFPIESSSKQVNVADNPTISNGIQTDSITDTCTSEVTPQAEVMPVTEEIGSTDGICFEGEEVVEMVTVPEKESRINISELTPEMDSPKTVLTPQETVMLESTPKPPPRSRRIRSRTVEILPKEKDPELNLRRSQSLSDIDVHERTSHLDVPTDKADLKNLYTSVNKDGKRTVLNGSQSSSLEKVSSRPLPAPPPPPRKFRSLDRKPKENRADVDSSATKFNTTGHSIPEAGSSDISMRPPDRKKKGDKHRFHSLSTERKTHEFQANADKMPRSGSAPSRPDRRPRHDLSEFDENGNVSFPIEVEVHRSAVVLDECGNEVAGPSSSTNIPVQDVIDSKVPKSSDIVAPHPRLRKGKNPKNPKNKSHSSWYDETLVSEESWEVVDWDPSLENASKYRGIFPTGLSRSMRRKSDPSGSRMQPTSKFYVNVDPREVAVLPQSDKETSPLHIDCSEKSVQTSLETLSQGIVSHDDKSESSDNTDNLLNIVKTLQSELKVTLNRHKSLDDENDSSSIVGTDSEKLDSRSKRLLETPSVQSSTSDVWPITSSDESDGETAHDGSGDMSEEALAKKKKKTFFIAQEIMSSEEVFVDTLKLLNVDFKAAVEAAIKQRNTLVIPEEIFGQIFNHLPQLQHLNENLLMELKDRIENWEKIGKIADVIVKIGPFLKLYSWFIHDFESNLSLLEDSKRKYPLFSQVVKEFEASPRCKRLSLNHYMLKPIQRIPQYRLLLQEYLHQLSEESPDYQDTVTALQIVSDVANHANESMKQGDNAQKLVCIQNSIIGHKEIIKPGRLFLKEGVLMKLSRKEMQIRYFVLFNDLLLYLTPVQQGLYRVNHDLSLTGMKVAIPIQQDYQHEFSIISAHRSFSLAARSLEEREEWIEALTKAIKENTFKRKTFTNVIEEQSMLGRNSEEDVEFVLGKEAPVWIPDDRVTMCQLCTSEFTVTFRRHHCRACGKVVCSVCSSNRIPLHYCKESKVKRVCDECYAKLGPGGSPENLETDSDNQQIAVKPHHRTDHRYVKKGKRNLPSVLKEVCANDQGSTISGYLQKRLGKNWKKEWFVVKDKVLYEYKASEDVAALKSTPLLGYQIESFTEAYENVDSSLLFQLTHPGQAPIVFHADSIGSTERWIAALKEATVLE